MRALDRLRARVALRLLWWCCPNENVHLVTSAAELATALTPEACSCKFCKALAKDD